MNELNNIQVKLIAPKNQRNNFGGFKYRSLEDILEALKPLLKSEKCTITFTDDLIALGERIFIKSTATITNSKGEKESSTSFAELDNHKGMSKEQSSGSASSYARKYALCSLAAIDDNADPDSLENQEQAPAPAPAQTRRRAVFSPAVPTAWESAKLKYAEGSLTREDVEKRYIVTNEIWEQFTQAADNLNK